MDSSHAATFEHAEVRQLRHDLALAARVAAQTLGERLQSALFFESLRRLLRQHDD
jgi:hypothetical protein